MAKKNKSCILTPILSNGEPSIVFPELQEYTKDRDTTIFLYSLYNTTQVQIAMDNSKKGYEKQANGEHKTKDIIDYLNSEFDNLVLNLIQMQGNINTALSEQLGLTKQGAPVVFTKVTEALNKIQELKNNRPDIVAQLHVLDNEKYVITIDKVNADNVYLQFQYLKDREALNFLLNKFSNVQEEEFLQNGIDLSNIQNFINLYVDLITKIHSLANRKTAYNKNCYASPEVLTIGLLLYGNQNQLSRLQTKLANSSSQPISINDVANTIFNYLYKGLSVTSDTETLIASTLQAMTKNIDNADHDFINELLEKLNIEDLSKQFINELKVNSDNLKAQILSAKEYTQYNKQLNTITDIKTQLLSNIQNQISKLKQLKEDLDSSPSLRAVIDPNYKTEQELLDLTTIQEELIHNYDDTNSLLGVFETLDYIQTHLNDLYATLDVETKKFDFNAPLLSLEAIKPVIKVLEDLRNFEDAYKQVVSILPNILKTNSAYNTLTQDQQNQVSDAIKIINTQLNNPVMSTIQNQYTKMLVTKIVNMYITKLDLSDQVAITQLIDHQISDSSLIDFLYSIDRVSNPLIAITGTIIRDAESYRNENIRKIQVEIDNITREAKRLGMKSTAFMYDYNYDTKKRKLVNGYIICDRNIAQYEQDKQAYIDYLNRSPYTQVEKDKMLQDWIYNHTESRIIDPTTGRVELIPDSSYYVDFSSYNLNAGEQYYYDHMMSIKGRLGSLMPPYGQKQYLAPQIRRNNRDLLTDALNPKKTIKISTALKEVFKSFYKVREGDPNYIENATTGEFQLLAQSDFNDYITKRIPVHGVVRLSDPSKFLLTDFSASLNLFTKEALHYSFMNDIKDIAEFMADYISNQPIEITDKRSKIQGIKKVKTIIDKFKSNNNSKKILQTALLQHIYRDNVKEGWNRKYLPLVQSLLALTSARALGGNIKGAIANVIQPEIQLWVDATSGEYFNRKDWVWAQTKLLEDGFVNLMFGVKDFKNNTTSNKVSVLMQFFDARQSQANLSYKRYDYTLARKLTVIDPFVLYDYGDYAVRAHALYAYLHNKKLKKVDANGKVTTINMYEALDIQNRSLLHSSSAKVTSKDHLFYEDEYGNLVKFDLNNEKTFLQIKKEIRYAIQTSVGAMNDEDKGTIAYTLLGRAALNLRTWMIEHYRRRFGGKHFDGRTQTTVQGFYVTAWQNRNALFGFFLKDCLHIETELLRNKNLSNHQKANLRRFLNDIAITLVAGIASVILDEEDYKGDFFARMLIWQLKRATADQFNAGFGVTYAMQDLYRNPFPITQTVGDYLYILMGILNGDIAKTVQRGPHKGENKYLYNMSRYYIPLYRRINELETFSEDSRVFNSILMPGQRRR